MFDVFDKQLKDKNLGAKIVNYFSGYNDHRDDYIVATSILTQDILANAFRVPVDHVLITGLPRKDVFFGKKSTKSIPFRCIYMPTLRGGVGDECVNFKNRKTNGSFNYFCNLP
jgi:CDP-glycerol glycerophosphotransferase